MRKYIGLTLIILWAIACDTKTITESTNVPNKETVVNSIPSPVPVIVAPTPTPDPKLSRSYITFGDGCAGTWCAVKGSADKVSIIATIPMRNDRPSIYGEWYVSAPYGKCVDFGRAETFMTFPGCGDLKVQCDASLGYGGGAHAGHIFTTVRATGNCPEPTPTPSPTPSPTPTPCVEQWIEQPPVITYTDWSTCHAPLVINTRDPILCDGVQERTVTTTINEVNSCTQETRVKSVITSTETQPCKYECHGNCFYNVPGDEGKQECMATPGFVSWNDQNHLCELAFPGVSDCNFNLNPGQSDNECLRKPKHCN